ADRIRVPAPAARTTTAAGWAVVTWTPVAWEAAGSARQTLPPGSAHRIRTCTARLQRPACCRYTRADGRHRDRSDEAGLCAGLRAAGTSLPGPVDAPATSR